MRVTAVVLSWNGTQETLACLRSLALVPRAVLERVGPFDEALFMLFRRTSTWSLRARAAGVHVLVVGAERGSGAARRWRHTSPRRRLSRGLIAEFAAVRDGWRDFRRGRLGQRPA